VKEIFEFLFFEQRREFAKPRPTNPFKVIRICVI